LRHAERAEGETLSEFRVDHFYIGISITYVFVVLFRPARQLLGHKNLKTTTQFYAGFDTRRAGLHHQRLIEEKIAQRQLYRRGRKRNGKSTF